jgi:hypothetical protein
MPRRIFGSKRDKMVRDWTKLHNDDLHSLYSSSDIIIMIKVKKNEMGRVCSTQGKKLNECLQVFGGRTRRRSLGRYKRSW